MFGMFKAVVKKVGSVVVDIAKKRAVSKITKLAMKSSVPTTVLLEIYNTVSEVEKKEKKRK